jgi:pyruvate dehydrogenase E1 component
MAFVRLLGLLLRNKGLAKHIVPIVPDEARTFGMEGLFRQLGIYASTGQLYEPVDQDLVMYYREARDGQVLEEGINEAGAVSSWIAAGTSYASYGVPMLPFYIFYSMFGFQRVGDFLWAAADNQARGFLLGATSGRTTLAGEGLQHCDGHSHVMASTIPSCRSYDPTYAYELAVIVQDGMRRMLDVQENCFYYITVMNESYVMPAMPDGAAEGIVRGMYLLKPAEGGEAQAQLLGSGAILREVIAAAELLEKDWNVKSAVWSVTSFTELARDGERAERADRLRLSDSTPSYVSTCLSNTKGPVIAATDYVRTYAEQIRAYVPRRYTVLGTDGFGRSDIRPALRRHFEVDRQHVVVATLSSLAKEGVLDAKVVAEAIQRYELSPAALAPFEEGTS